MSTNDIEEGKKFLMEHIVSLEYDFIKRMLTLYMVEGICDKIDMNSALKYAMTIDDKVKEIKICSGKRIEVFWKSSSY